MVIERYYNNTTSRQTTSDSHLLSLNFYRTVMLHSGVVTCAVWWETHSKRQILITGCKVSDLLSFD